MMAFQTLTGFIVIMITMAVGFIIFDTLKSDTAMFNNPLVQNTSSQMLETVRTATTWFPFLMIVVVIMGIIGVVSGVKFNNYETTFDSTYEDTPEEEKPHKQTYLEFVKDQLKVERLLR